MGELKVGGEVDAFCTKCKLVLAHTVLAIWAEQIKRVRCNTCMGEHGYRRAGGSADSSSSSSSRPRAARVTAAPKARAASEPAVAASYSELLAGKDPAGARRYDVKLEFAPGDLVQHPTFGLGVVAAVRGLEKIDVAFPHSVKTLMHRKGAGPAALARPLPAKSAPDLADDPNQPDPAAETSDEPEGTPAGG
jgi:hypothetical protein